MADQEKEEFSNPSGGQIIGFILKVLGGGFFGIIALGTAINVYTDWDFQKKVDRCNDGETLVFVSTSGSLPEGLMWQVELI